MDCTLWTSKLMFLQKVDEFGKPFLHDEMNDCDGNISLIFTNDTNFYLSLREKCLYSELFLSAFSRIWTEYGEIQSIQSECGKIRTRITPNTDTFYAVFLPHLN